MSERVPWSYEFVNPWDFESNASTSSAIRPFRYSLMFTCILCFKLLNTQQKISFISLCSGYALVVP